jgi:hypothetical protein
MIKDILKLLELDPHYGQSETIEIAKGKYSIPKTWKQGFEQIKRQWKQR